MIPVTMRVVCASTQDARPAAGLQRNYFALATTMAEHLTVVTETLTGCRILRDLRGSYVVNHRDHHDERRNIATLAGAYATCRQLEPALSPAGGDAGRANPPADCAPT